MSSRFNLDLNREERLGFPEAIYGERKDVDSLLGIIEKMKRHEKPILITRLQKDKFEKIREPYPHIFYDEISKVCVLGEFPGDRLKHSAGVISAGTTDAAVVNEVYYTLKFHGVPAERIQDIGVSGIHRLFSKLDEIKRFKVLIVIAGFEGALPTVVGGLVPQPIIAVPTSVGYGVAEGGRVAMSAMLTSCANGITVVNIDNGYGAAMAAHRILHAFND
jgi:NCAIR mutase (PurE)-related protein